MSHLAHDPLASPSPEGPTRIGVAIRRAFAKGYNRDALLADLNAGAVVAVVALALSMALAIAIGVDPQHGLYSAIVAGIVVALTGGSKFQISGPSATFIVTLVPVVAKHGLSGALLVGAMAGVLLVAMGFAKLGRLIQYIPYPVTTGFTVGVAIVIASLQVKDAFGLVLAEKPDSFTEGIVLFWQARNTGSWSEFAIALTTLTLLIASPKYLKKVPAPLVALGAAALLAALATHLSPHVHIATIGNSFHTTVLGTTYDGIPRLPPRPVIPWSHLDVSMRLIRELFPSAFAIAMLAAIESLLSAVVSDGMRGTRHDPNAELVGLGLGNIAAAFFGGIAATGALARTATNVRLGARSPLSSVFHSLTILFSILLFAPLVSRVPMASLAALLMVVAWNMADVPHLLRIMRLSPKSDRLVFAACVTLTVFFDMVMAISVGVVMAALLFMRRMAELTRTRPVMESVADSEDEIRALPNTIAIYEIAGPLFFGAAQNAMNALTSVHADTRVVVVDLSHAPAIDASGVVALESAFAQLYRNNQRAIIAGPLPEPHSVFERAELSRAYIVGSRSEAIALAKDLVENHLMPDGPPSRSHIPPPVR